MDMKEMVDKAKKGEPLYGTSTLSPYMQGVSARNSRYSATFLYALPFFNFTNHEHVSRANKAASCCLYLLPFSMGLIQRNTTNKRSGN